MMISFEIAPSDDVVEELVSDCLTYWRGRVCEGWLLNYWWASNGISVFRVESDDETSLDILRKKIRRLSRGETKFTIEWW
ncbi:hypothetical protein LCGC14_2005240 [marine sediment metagenome]|uniref:Uncharacterized protein n=1 Tax=marine sediment metagenome TaxID=412755 RepID=A0A0F9HFD8_9ZZZZ